MRPSPGICGVVLCAALTACQSGPTAPVPMDQTGILPAGRYLLSVGTMQAQDPACIGQNDAWGLFGPNIGAFVVLSAQGDAWVGRLESPLDGTLELHLRQGSGTAAAPTITGTLRGTMTHLVDRLLPTPARTVSFAGKDADNFATIDATLYQPGALIGTASGDVTFTHSSGTALACPEVTLTVGREP